MRTGFVYALKGVTAACVLGMLGCQQPTSFEGEAKFPGGAHGCFERCAAEQMDMASFVYVGEYSTACACQPRRASGAGPTSDADRLPTAVVAAAAGAEMQRRRIAAQQAAAANASRPVYVGH